MAYGLRRINENRIHYGFKWPLEVGVTVECPDWDPKPKCGNGLHLLPNALGNWMLLFHGHWWTVVEYDEHELVMIDDGKGKVPRCKIIEIQHPEPRSPAKLLSYFDISKFDSQNAYFWAWKIGNHDIMKPRVTEPRWIDVWNYKFPNNRIKVTNHGTWSAKDQQRWSALRRQIST